MRTDLPPLAASYSAAIVRAWPTASARPSRGPPAPRIAAETSASSSAYGLAARTGTSSRVPPGRVSVSRGAAPCHGSCATSVPPSPTTSIAPSAGTSKPQSNVPSTSSAKRSTPANLPSTPPRAHAVAADIHQRAPVEVGLEPHVAGVGGREREPEAGPHDPQRRDLRS